MKEYQDYLLAKIGGSMTVMGYIMAKINYLFAIPSYGQAMDSIALVSALGGMILVWVNVFRLFKKKNETPKR